MAVVDKVISRPVLFGYICRQLLTNLRQIATFESGMKGLADAGGFSLGHTYFEEAVSSPVAFGALVEALNHSSGGAVLLPGLTHFAVLGPRHDIRKLFEQVTGVPVLIL